jgi:hypothetical protein
VSVAPMQVTPYRVDAAELMQRMPRALSSTTA